MEGNKLIIYKNILWDLLDEKITLKEVVLDCIDIEFFIKMAGLLEINTEKEIEELQSRLSKFSITGNDLISIGIKPDKTFKDLLRNAKLMQLKGLSKEEVLNNIALLKIH